MMSTSSSSPPSTRHTVRAGASHLRSSRAFCQRCVRHSWRRRPQCCQVRACRRSTVHRWPATIHWTSGRKSTAVEVGRTVAPPSSATVRGVEASRVATSRDFDPHAPVGARQVAHAPLPPSSLGVSRGGVHGVGPTPACGGLAA
jgi:hypothetical protein